LITTQALFFLSSAYEPYVYIAPKTNFSTCLSSYASPTIFALFSIHFLLSAGSTLILALFHADGLEWISFRNASSMSFVFVATIVLEAIVNPPNVWFVLIPIIRGVSLFIMQSSLMYGLLKAREAGTSLALSEFTTKIQYPSELETAQSGVYFFGL
jgi:hypothetical protein